MKRIRNAILSVVLTCCMVLPGVMVSAENMDNVQVNTNEENQIATDGSENTEDTDETAEAESQTENTETDIYEAERNDLANSWRYENGQRTEQSFARSARAFREFTTWPAVSGTPAGVGMGFDPPRFLKPGDVVECVIEGIGTLKNPVVE